MDPTLSFKLPEEFIENINYEPEISDNGLGKFVMYRTYFRKLFDGDKFIGNETYKQVVERVVNGTFTILKDRLISLNKWDEEKYIELAKKFYNIVYNFKVTPPGRGFWAMGTPLVHKKNLALSLVNCTFITSKNIDEIRGEFFAFIMDALMLGVGVGFDDLGAGKLRINSRVSDCDPDTDRPEYILDDLRKMSSQSVSKHPTKHFKFIDFELELTEKHLLNSKYCIIKIEDNREGWVKAVKILIDSYLIDAVDYFIIFDYSDIRPSGIPLRTFGGTSSGPKPLCEGISSIRWILERNSGGLLSSVDICDISNIIATIVIAGNVRRSSQIFLSSNPEAVEYKNYNNDKYKYRMNWCWSSNNSVISDGLLSSELLQRIKEGICLNGEPGIFNKYICRNYGRIIDGFGDYDTEIDGTNPCGEISLQGMSKFIYYDRKYNKTSTGSGQRVEPDDFLTTVEFKAGGETCNLSEVFVANYKDKDAIDNIEQDLYFAVLYCKLVASLPVHWESTDDIQRRNMRIGVSQTGIIEFMTNHGISLDEYKYICDRWYKKVREYDNEISALLEVNRSIKVTTVKPSGTVSLCGGLFGAGMHSPPAKYFIRNVRISNERKDLLDVLRDKGYKIEDDVTQIGKTSVISFPCKSDNGVVTKQDTTVEYQFKLLALLQCYWSDNQVSCTISFRSDEAHKLPQLIMEYSNSIKSLSLLPFYNGVYAQAPEITLNETEYNQEIEKISPVSFDDLDCNHEYETELDNYCSGGKCIR